MGACRSCRGSREGRRSDCVCSPDPFPPVPMPVGMSEFCPKPAPSHHPGHGGHLTTGNAAPLTRWQSGSVSRCRAEPRMASAAFLGGLAGLQVTPTKGKARHLLWPRVPAARRICPSDRHAGERRDRRELRHWHTDINRTWD